MIDFLFESWNDILTAFAFLLSFFTGVYQIHHYRAQSPNIDLIGTSNALYGRDPEPDMGATRYDFEVNIQNKGRSPTTIKGGELNIHKTRENLELSRIEGSEAGPLKSINDSNRPHIVRTSIRIPGNDTLKVKYRAIGSHFDHYPEKIDSQVTLRSVNGDKTTQQLTFKKRHT